MNIRQNKITQLEKLLRLYPDIPVSIEGIILDYIAETRSSLYDVFRINNAIYENLFLPEEKREKAISLIRATLRDEANYSILRESCERIFSEIPKLLDLLEQQVQEQAPYSDLRPDVQPDELAGFPVQCIIWQLSDIHFGDFNVLENDPKQLAAILGKAAHEFKLKPNLIIVSGDLTSRANNAEFKKFLKFSEYLSEIIWSRKCPECFLVVPGNHDTSWTRGGKADKLKRFREHCLKQDIYISPFISAKEPSASDCSIRVERPFLNNGEMPPFALVKYKELSLEILLLISSYYSGFVPEEIRNTLRKIEEKELREDLEKLLREDKGEVSRDYIRGLSQHLSNTKNTRLGVVHHNMCQFQAFPCVNTLSPGLLETLFMKNTTLLLHGHVHLTEEPFPIRHPIRKQTYPVPCTSLTSHCSIYNKGFNIHMLGYPSDTRSIVTFVWQLSGTTFFTERHFSLRYRFKSSPNEFSVEHGKYVF